MDENTNLNNTSEDQTTDTTPDTSKDVDNKPDKEEKPEKTFTQEQVNSFLRKERLKWEKNNPKNNADKYKDMTKEEKTDARMAELEAKLAAYEAKEARAEMVKAVQGTLSENNLDISFAEFLVNDDADITKTNVDNFTKAWNKALEKAVNKKIAGTTPKTGDPKKSTTTVFTLDEIKKMKPEDIIKHKKEVEESLKKLNNK